MMRPNGVEKQVRPSGWQPNNNTIAYRPLTDNLIDVVGGYDLSIVGGSQCTFTTDLSGNKCCFLNQNQNDTYLANSSIYSQFSASNDFTLAIKMGEGIVRPSSWASSHVFSFNRQCNVLGISQLTQDVPAQGTIFIGSEGLGYNGNTTSYITPLKITDSVIHSCVITLKYQDKISLYIDNVLAEEVLRNNSSLKTINQFVIGKDLYDNSTGRYLSAKISHIVAENGIWDSQRIADYNNL